MGMIRNLVMTLFLTAALSFPALAAEFSSVVEDLPLMPGMTELKDSAVIFDKPGGRIVETAAATAAKPDDVRAFYATALPPLGWTAAKADTYTRNGETLTVTPGDKTVQFKITPSLKGQ